MTHLAVENLYVRRGNVSVIAGLDLVVSRASWVALIGANGSGKTTLLRAIAGRLPITGGRIRVDGVDRAGERSALALMTGFALPCEHLPLSLSAAELFAAITWGQSRAVAAVDAAPVFDALALGAHLERPIGTLSAGLRQRVALYGAFLLSPALVVLDEPFNWLDPLVAYDLKLALAQVVQRGTTLITALHDTGSTLSYCDRLLVMNTGAIVHDLAGEALRRATVEPARLEAELVGRLRASDSSPSIRDPS